jgi:hypothetical protein
MDSLADDVGMTTPPPTAGERGTTPLPVADLGTSVTWEREVLFGTSECQLLHASLMWTPSAQGLLELMTTWLRTNLRLARRWEVRGHSAHRYLTPFRRA